MRNGEGTAVSVGKFYIKTNIVISHPKDIAKKESINNYAMDVVSGKEVVKDGDVKEEMMSRSKIRKEEYLETREDDKSPRK